MQTTHVQSIPNGTQKIQLVAFFGSYRMRYVGFIEGIPIRYTRAPSQDRVVEMDVSAVARGRLAEGSSVADNGRSMLASGWLACNREIYFLMGLAPCIDVERLYKYKGYDNLLSCAQCKFNIDKGDHVSEHLTFYKKGGRAGWMRLWVHKGCEERGWPESPDIIAPTYEKTRASGWLLLVLRGAGFPNDLAWPIVAAVHWLL